jgi:hypothetical protein
MAKTAAATKPKEVKLRKADNRIQVIDPKGEVFEMSHRNAHDLVNHKGWSFPKSEEDKEAEVARAPRSDKNKKRKDALPKGVEKPGNRKVNRVPTNRNPGHGPIDPVDTEVERIKAEYDDDEGNDIGEDEIASPAENEDD